MDRITDRLYLGDINGCSNLYMLRKNKITHILTMAAGIRPLYRKEFKYKVVDVMDLPTQNMLPYLTKAIEFINKAVANGGRVLVHCFAGVSRSATTVIAYFMATRKMTFMEAFNYVKKRRPIIFPNFGFQKQLLEFEKQLAEKWNKKELSNKIKDYDNKNQKSIDVYQKDPSSLTPFTKHNKLIIHEKTNKHFGKSPKPRNKHGQVIPTQFHYP